MHFSKKIRPTKSELYAAYWQFTVKRHQVFRARLANPAGPWTTDPILSKYRFTNVFRSLDRVTQHLIRLQQEVGPEAEELFFTTLLFKIFNKIETYRYLEQVTGRPTAATFSAPHYNTLLGRRMAGGARIYSAAYIMPSAGRAFGFERKHSNHLALLERMLRENLPRKIQACASMADVYRLLLAYPSLGKFLAFQYTIDLNYSSLTDFSEMDFVVAGPGAINGITKCFSSLGEYSYEDVIRLMADEQEAECDRLGLTVPSLWGRRLQLIDCQNLFCEVDKYLRGTHPATISAGGQTRIKQHFTANPEAFTLYFPPKWGLTPTYQSHASIQ